MRSLLASLSLAPLALAAPQTEEARIANGAPGLGASAAVHADTVVLGRAVASSFDGAFVFVRDATGWSEQQELVPSGSIGPGDQYGIAVGTHGDTAVVTASFEAGYSGTAVVFERGGTVWTETQQLVASDAAPDSFFGDAVSVRGDRIVVGAGCALVGGQHHGAAYVFERAGTTWTETHKLAAAAPVGIFFGFAIAQTDDVILVGRPVGDTGAAHVFRRSGSDWVEEQVLVPADGAAGDRFGWAVALHDTRALVGAPRHDAAGTDAGAAYVFEHDGTAWTQVAKLVALDAAADDQLGARVALGPAGAVVGAALDDDAGRSSGAAYLFGEGGGGWRQTAKLVASDASAGARFGDALALDGPRLVVGAPGASAGYVFAVEEPECYLVLGTGRGTTEFTPGTHTFTPQLARVVEHHPVLLDDIPDFPLPFAPGAPTPGYALRTDLADPSGPVEYWAQVLMWNPQVFPDLPEQWTDGVRVIVFPNGGLLVRHFGHSTGMEILPELARDAQGRAVVRFPFTIPGL